jgi:hypothetical protein
MSEAIDNFCVGLAKMQASAARELQVLLNGRINWRASGTDLTEHNADAWQAEVGDWRLAVVDFSIEDQPGRRPGERGQNMVLSNTKTHLVIMSDGKEQHELARHFMEKIKANASVVTIGIGAGKTLASWTAMESENFGHN